jgi:hypothetical protein
MNVPDPRAELSAPGESTKSPSDERQTVPFLQERIEESRLHDERLNLEPMFRLALDPRHLEPGETRLVARVDEVIPGEVITPSASQVRGATLIVAHLEYAPLPAPQKDRNTRKDIKAEEEGAEEDEPIDF